MSFNIEQKNNFNIVTSTIDVFGGAEFTTLTQFLEENNSLGRNTIFDISQTKEMNSDAMHQLTAFQEGSYNLNVSFIICCGNQDLYEDFQTLFPTDTMIITPTLAEAIDLVSMEILERELMQGDEDSSEAQDYFSPDDI
jgi:anti-anti-sigma regulatory factor